MRPRVQPGDRHEDWKTPHRPQKPGPVLKVDLDDRNEDWQVQLRKKRKREQGSRF
jgi:hypothetical protein